MDQATHDMEREVEPMREGESNVWMQRARVTWRLASIAVAVLGAVKAVQTVRTGRRQRQRAALVERRLRSVQA